MYRKIGLDKLNKALSEGSKTQDDPFYIFQEGS